MSIAAGSPRMEWLVATVEQVVQETPTTRTLVLHVPGWPGHRAGQHVDVRLTAQDGYQAERSYSIASPPGEAHLALTVEQLPGGEVSEYLCGELRMGDRFELRGPIGGYFVWDPAAGGPLLLVAGGSGIVPLMAMLRYRAAALPDAAARRGLPARLLYSSRRWVDVIYRHELAARAARDPTLAVTQTITREPPARWTGFRRRIDTAMLREVAWPPVDAPRVFVCGPAPFVEVAAAALVELGHSAERIKTERFGPTG